MASEQPAADAFALLSDENRVDILRAIATAQHEQEPSNSGYVPLSFSAIYERVDVDSTSKLSYHLGELTGTYLQKTEEGYWFTHAGDRIARFILAENFREPVDVDPIETSGTCLHCGESHMVAELDDQYFVVRCRACDELVTGYVVTPAQTRTHSGTTLLDSLKRKQAIEFALVQRGICPECGGRIRTTVFDVGEQPLLEEVSVSYATVDECESCLRQYSAPLSYGAAYHSASIAFHWDHGVDLTEIGWWELHQYLVDGHWTAERIATDPEAYRVVLRHDDDALRVFLDDGARVTRTERVRGWDVD